MSEPIFPPKVPEVDDVVRISIKGRKRPPVSPQFCEDRKVVGRYHDTTPEGNVWAINLALAEAPKLCFEHIWFDGKIWRGIFQDEHYFLKVDVIS